MTGEQQPVLPHVRLPGGRVVPERALSERTSTSGGPGGQHANKVATRVDLRIALSELPLTEAEFARVREKLGSRLTRDDELIVSAATARSQLANRQEARRRAEALLLEALTRQPPRRPTRTPRAALRRIREAKQQQSQRKAGRRWRPGDDG